MQTIYPRMIYILIILSIIIASDPTVIHEIHEVHHDDHHLPHDPMDCPACKSHALEDANHILHSDHDSYNADIHRGDKGVGDFVFTSDAIHHGTGLYISRNPLNDIVRGKHTSTNLNIAMKNAEDEAQAADIKASKDRAELLKLEQTIAEKEAHRARHNYEVLLKEMMTIENEKKKSPEVYAKKTAPVIVVTQESAPFAHHDRQILHFIQNVRAANKSQIEAQQKIVKLEDITADVAAMNPGIKDPEMYKHIMKISGADPAIIDVPIRPDNGKFYISPVDKAHENMHALQAEAHSNNPGKVIAVPPQVVTAPVVVNAPVGVTPGHTVVEPVPEVHQLPPVLVPAVNPIIHDAPVVPVVEPAVPAVVPVVEPAVVPVVEPAVVPAVEPAVVPAVVPAVTPVVHEDTTEHDPYISDSYLKGANFDIFAGKDNELLLKSHYLPEYGDL
jgi:hypothetical protein